MGIMSHIQHNTHMTDAERIEIAAENEKRNKIEMKRRSRFEDRMNERNRKTNKASREWKKILVGIKQDPNIVNRGGVPTNATTGEAIGELEIKRQAYLMENRRRRDFVDQQWEKENTRRDEYDNAGNTTEVGKCPICLDTLDHGTEEALVPCGHVLHSNCIQQIRNHNPHDLKCPLCRRLFTGGKRINKTRR